jgi:NAD+ synthase (glutamine-hydrolysing)
LRPFLYVVNWPWQFNKIRDHVEEMERGLQRKREEKKENQMKR